MKYIRIIANSHDQYIMKTWNAETAQTSWNSLDQTNSIFADGVMCKHHRL